MKGYNRAAYRPIHRYVPGDLLVESMRLSASGPTLLNVLSNQPSNADDEKKELIVLASLREPSTLRESGSTITVEMGGWLRPHPSEHVKQARPFGRVRRSIPSQATTCFTNELMVPNDMLPIGSPTASYIPKRGRDREHEFESG